MWNSFFLFIFSFFIISCQKNSDCKQEVLQSNFEKLDSSYNNWKYMLNYMDEITIQEANTKLDAALLNIAPCNIFPTDFSSKIDSVSIIFGAYNIDRAAIENAEQMVESLDSIMLDKTLVFQN